jgi:hypothetical protein
MQPLLERALELMDRIEEDNGNARNVTQNIES